MAEDEESKAEIQLSLTVNTTNADQVVKTAEIMARAAAGLVLDGIDAEVSMGVVVED